MRLISVLCSQTFKEFHFPRFVSPRTSNIGNTRKLYTMETVKQTIAQNLGGDSHKLVASDQQFALEQIPSLTGKVAVVTGGSEGIGYGCTHSLLSHGVEKLFILSVSKDVVDGAISAVGKEMGDEVAKRMTWLQCDLSDWNQTKETAEKIIGMTDRLDILINNAARGIMTYQLTDYGVDRHVSPILQSRSKGEADRSSIDGCEPYRPRDLDLLPPPSYQKDCFSRVNGSHRQLCFKPP